MGCKYLTEAVYLPREGERIQDPGWDSDKGHAQTSATCDPLDHVCGKLFRCFHPAAASCATAAEVLDGKTCSPSASRALCLFARWRRQRPKGTWSNIGLHTHTILQPAVLLLRLSHLVRPISMPLPPENHPSPTSLLLFVHPLDRPAKSRTLI